MMFKVKFMKDIIKECFEDSIDTKRFVMDNLTDEIELCAKIMIDALKKGNKILVCGNGGSAGDTQHFVAELIVRFEKERISLPAIALTTDTSIITACGNDFGYDRIFERQIEGLGREGDVLVGITTSGNSMSIIKGFEAARKIGMKMICLNGKDGGKISKMNLGLDVDLKIPSKNTARIQESHITIIHIWCKLIDMAF